MANTFKRYTSNSIGTSLATVYTVPGSTTSVVIGGIVANVTADTVNITVTATTSSTVINLIVRPSVRRQTQSTGSHGRWRRGIGA